MPLRYLFVDMNSFFASVEQQDDPRLRGRPVGVVPVLADSTSLIAASVQAKRLGVKTGTPVWEAKRLIPGIALRVGRHERYVEVHHGIVRAVGRCLPVDKVMSVDEMACKLLGDERKPDVAAGIARRIKAELRAEVGECVTCSVGVGPSVVLAKVAGDMMKPDGLTILRPEELPVNLYGLQLTDFPGIGPRMEARFHRFGVTTVQQLYRLTARQLSDVWGSRVHGERWFHLLRGEDVTDKPTRRRTLGHSHVLPPDLRTDAGSYMVLAKLVHKAAARLRTIDYWTGSLSIGVRYAAGPRWDAGCKLPRCQDTLTLLRAFGELWKGRPRSGQPRKVSLTLADLLPARSATPSLFPEDRQSNDVSHAMDRVNRSFGKNSVRYGVVCGAEEAAPTRIAFTRVPEFNPALT